MRISPQANPARAERRDLAKRTVNFGNLTKDRGDTVYIGLVGGHDPASAAVRHAQAHMRFDRRPSYFSDVFVVRPRKGSDGILWAPVIGADPRRPERFGIRTGSYDDFASVAAYPNVVVIAVTLEENADDRMRNLRRAFDQPEGVAEMRHLWELVSAWQPYLFEPDRAPNPLHEGVSHPGTVLARWLLGTVGVEGAPGATEDADAPEHLWAFCKWWGEAAADPSVAATIRYYRNITDPGCSVADPP